jgi:hypothetical protein
MSFCCRFLRRLAAALALALESSVAAFRAVPVLLAAVLRRADVRPAFAAAALWRAEAEEVLPVCCARMPADWEAVLRLFP